MNRKARADYACAIGAPESPPRPRDGSRGRTRGREAPSRSRTPSPAAAAVSSGTLPEKDFKGCWWCGIEGHSKHECKKLKALRDKNGGRIPRDTPSAYDLWYKKNMEIFHGRLDPSRLSQRPGKMESLHPPDLPQPLPSSNRRSPGARLKMKATANPS